MFDSPRFLTSVNAHSHRFFSSVPYIVLFAKDLELEECHRLAFANARDIIACGFDIEKTFIFSDLDYIQHMYPNILKIGKRITYNQIKGCFGFSQVSCFMLCYFIYR